MRALVAATLALLVALAASAPHDHVKAAHGGSECMACTVGQTGVAHDETPDVAPAPVVSAAPVEEPGAAPVSGAPLGAIPGQSPPALA